MAHVEKERDGWRSWLFDEYGRVIDEDEIQLARLSGRRRDSIARLTPDEERSRERISGRDRGLFTVPDDFDAPLPDEVIDRFYK